MAASLRPLFSQRVRAATSHHGHFLLRGSARSLFSTLSASVADLEYDAAHDDYLVNVESDRHDSNIQTNPISLNEFAVTLPAMLHRQNQTFVNNLRGSSSDPVTQLFSRIRLTSADYQRCVILDPTISYTRSLVATDDETFSLLLLCWNPDTGSPIHDHPCDGCWVRVCDGIVKETRYRVDEERDRLEVSSEKFFDICLFLNGFVRYHKVSNPSKSVPAISMHLYCPPFEKCKIWLDPRYASKSSERDITYHNS